ncbi:MAG TPA: hypothetical protein VJS20_11855 [Gemmatimonadales bacterium]|nr:hypothetical protein [Gemmatimonadales bacterium]
MTARTDSRGPLSLIIPGAAVFVLALTVSALFEADLRGLHFFQAWLYVATVALSIRRNRWGYFVGISTALLWNYALFFTSPLFADLIKTPTRPDILVQTLAWVGNLAIIVGCLWAYSRQPVRPRGDWGRLALAFIGSTGFLVLIVAIFTPSRLALFPALLHPHWPF